MNFISIAPGDLEPRRFHRLLLEIVVPRPIGLISTVSESGTPNLAPFSYYQALSVQPPAVMFSPNRDRFGREKHSLINARATMEFVANAVTEDMAEAMNLASGEFPEDVSEFAEAGFTPLPSDLVKPPRVAESPVQMECRVLQIVELSRLPLGGSVVIGEIVRVHLHRDVYDPDSGIIRAETYRPLSRLGGVAYAPVREVFQMPRPKMTPEGKVVPGSHLKTKGER